MDEHAGYQWRIQTVGDGWRWTIQSREDGVTVLVGDVSSRPQAAACVVRALIRGMTERPQPQRLAA